MTRPLDAKSRTAQAREDAERDDRAYYMRQEASRSGREVRDA